jgi:DNA ligase 4
MPLQFTHVCELLSKLETLKIKDPPLIPKVLELESRRVIEYWFRGHRKRVDAPATDLVALLSTLFPEKRADRVYGLQEARLSKVIGRCLGLNTERNQLLQEWKYPGKGDLGACVERAQKIFDCEPKPGAAVTVEEVDHALQQLASRCRFSGPEVRVQASPIDAHEILDKIFSRLKSDEAKWLTRLILKDFSPVILDASLVLRSIHFLLPGLLRFQDNFAAAIRLLRGPLRRYDANPDAESQRIFKQAAAKVLSPEIGVKVGRPPFFKARSFDHCMKMAASNRWTIERKYDGEYCEIHVDLSKGSDCIQIFSKSGKDSTEDRKAVHDTIRDALRIGKSKCLFKKRCIVVGELLVYSDQEQSILGFEKIRKHVSRSGRILGTDEDSQAHEHEHLMIVFFDVLLIDDCIAMGKPHKERRELLSRLIDKKPGHAITSEWQVQDFSKEHGKQSLVYQFSIAVAARAEGLVLKPTDLPYFSFAESDAEASHAFFIKVKKDYMQELGGERDVADFAVVGASYDPKLASRLGIRNLHFTAFHLGCVANPDEIRFGHAPLFEIVGTISADQCIPRPELQALNTYGIVNKALFEHNKTRLKNPGNFDLKLGWSDTSKMSIIFTEPCVVEVLGSGFEKPSNKSYFMLRHARILKLHLDRSWKDTVTLNGLQELADVARNAPAEGESQEIARLVEKLIGKAERKAERDRARMTTPRTAATTISPKSPPKSRSTVNSSTRRRQSSAQTSSPPPLVRIDTAELLRGKPVSSHQAAGSILQPRSNGCNSLPTTPVSSPDEPIIDNGKSSAATSVENSATNSASPSGQKRNAQASDNTAQTVQPAKRLRVAVASMQRATDRHGTIVPIPMSSRRPSDSDADRLWKSWPKQLQQNRDHVPSQPTPAQHTSNTANQAPTDSPPEVASTSPSPTALRRTRIRQAVDVALKRKSSLEHRHDPSDNIPIVPIQEGECNYQHPSDHSLCPFSNAVVYLNPCLASSPWIQSNLVPGHGALVITNLAHWARDTHLSESQQSNTIAESQSYPGKVKIALVERRRPSAFANSIEEAVTLGIRERILWFDWKVLEEWALNERSRISGRITEVDVRKETDEVFGSHFLGVTEWVEGKRCVDFKEVVDWNGMWLDV